MATRQFVRTEEAGRTYRYVWSLASGDVGAPISIPGASDRTVQVFGTFNGATVAIEGSIEKTVSTYFSLTDHNGNVISFTSAGGEFVAENTVWLRPTVTGGDAATALTVILLTRSTMS